ncbi:MAG: hypothetical protein ACTSVI_11355 [Promethearchaeota archaeon]
MQLWFYRPMRMRYSVVNSKAAMACLQSQFNNKKMARSFDLVIETCTLGFFTSLLQPHAKKNE